MKLLPNTQKHLDIVDIQDNIVLLKGGKFRMVVEATAINFDLLSEDEQSATIYAYANIVNSLDYPVQVLIRTRQVDISNYIEYLEKHLREQPTAALRQQLSDYIEFVQQLVAENTVLQKRFFIVLPYFHVTTGQGNRSGPLDLLGWIKGLTGQKTYEASPEILKKARRTLTQRFEDLRWQFRRLGVKLEVLDSEGLIRLFYEIYNPEGQENRGVQEDVYGYTTGVVRSSLRPAQPVKTEGQKEKQEKKQEKEGQ